MCHRAAHRVTSPMSRDRVVPEPARDAAQLYLLRTHAEAWGLRWLWTGEAPAEDLVGSGADGEQKPQRSIVLPP